MGHVSVTNQSQKGAVSMSKKNYTSFVIGAILIGTATFACAQKKEEVKPADELLQPQTGVGAKYGARDPFTCKSTKQPLQGAPSAEQAKAYLIGRFEKETGTGTLGQLYLTENVKLEIGKGRPFEQGDGSGDADVSELVYPIRGSFTYYRCYPINSVYPVGQSCKKIESPNAEGFCYKTTFGDWRCSMVDIQTSKTLDGYFPAPK
jgi:hypothetical protein